MNALEDRFGALMADVAADRDRPDLARRQSLLTGAYREDRAALVDLTFAARLTDAERARAEQRGFDRGLAAARVPGQRKGRHAGGQGPILNLVKTVLPAGLAGFAVKLWTAHRIAVPVATAALAASVITAGVQMQDAPYQVSTPPAHAPAAVIAAADPIPSQSPAAVKHPKRHRDRRKVIALLLPPPPAASPSPSPSPSSTSASPAPLLLSTAELDLGVYVAGRVTIGGSPDQPVSWSVTCGQDLTVIPSQGILEPGQQGFPVRVSVDAVDGASSGTCTFEPGGEVLTVTWDGAGAPSAAAS